MNKPNLILNILTFDPPVEEKEFSFSLENGNDRYPIKKSECWFAFNTLYRESVKEKVNYLYSNFSNDLPDSQNVIINLTKSTKFAKHYYTWLIYNYFKDVADIINKNFVNDVQIWFHDKSQSKPEYNAYRTFTIRVQFDLNSKYPELVISYDGIKLIHKKNILDCNVETTLIRKVVYENEIWKYEQLPDAAKQNLSNVYPILNNTMKLVMGIPILIPPPDNRYKTYLSQLNDFVKAHLLTKEFKTLIPLRSDDFLKVDSWRIKNTSQGSNLLEFGGKKTHINPYFGLDENGPFDHCQGVHYHMFFVFHESDLESAKKLYTYFLHGYKNFKALNHLTGKPIITSSTDHIIFKNLENPIPEIKQQISEKQLDSNIQHIAIYLSPYSKNEQDESKHQFYYQIKEILLWHNVTSQVVEAKKISDPNYNYSLVNIGIAILAKLGGVPWRLSRDDHQELVLGVGAFKPRDCEERYIGSAFCFSNDGHFRGFECYSENTTYNLAVSISQAIIQYRKKYDEVKRLIIHFYKTMSEKELQPILKELEQLNLDIPVIIITINKTESRDLVLFDTSFPELIPISGTFIGVGRNQFLLCNNTRYSTKAPSKTEGYPFPIKLSINSTHEELLEDKGLINELIDQVYQFSRMYWKSVRQQNLPVTIKYPEMVAEIFPYFEKDTLPPFGKNNLWFL
jgi:hypothetical protein